MLDTWLYGSLLLPFMLLARWGGSKWKRLDWLVRSRNRWLLVWACYGFAKTIAFGTIVLFKYSPDFFPGFEYLRWVGTEVQHFVFAFNLHRVPELIWFLIALSLKGLVDAAVDCGLAAAAWWTNRSLTRGVEIRQGVRTAANYGVSLLLAATGIGIANVFHFSRGGTCFDCFRPDGVPFTFFHEGGFFGGDGFVWKGVIEEAVFVIGVGMILGVIWNSLSLRLTKER